jgi:Aspartyl protease
MRPPVLLILAASLLVLATHRGAAQSGPVPMELPSVQVEMAADSVVLPMRLVDGRVIVNALINGKGPFPFVLDTGAHGSVVDLAFAREESLALGPEILVGSPGGPARPGHLVPVERLDIGGLSLRHLTVVAFDGLPFKGADAPRGVLSPYGLKGLLVTLDYPGSRLAVTRGALPAPDGREVFGWEAGQPLPLVPILVAGHEVRVHLDSGASRGLSLPPSLAQTLPLSGPLVEIGHAKTVDREVVLKGAPLKGAVTIGRYELENPTIVFSDAQKDVGSVGPPILRQFAVTIDPANRRIRLSGPRDGRLAAYKERSGEKTSERPSGH